jgi:hypothetical protein
MVTTRFRELRDTPSTTPHADIPQADCPPR